MAGERGKVFDEAPHDSAGSGNAQNEQPGDDYEVASEHAEGDENARDSTALPQKVIEVIHVLHQKRRELAEKMKQEQDEKKERIKRLKAQNDQNEFRYKSASSRLMREVKSVIPIEDVEDFSRKTDSLEEGSDVEYEQERKVGSDEANAAISGEA